jgi:polyisoprenoid-binding protein YceI
VSSSGNQWGPDDIAARLAVPRELASAGSETETAWLNLLMANPRVASRVPATLLSGRILSGRTVGRFLLFPLLACGLAPTTLRGERLSIELDPQQSTVTFTLGAFLHTVRGTFRVKHGTVRFDTETGEATGEVVVDLTSGDTGNSSRDRKMREDVLESPRYPEAVFTLERIEGHPSLQGESQLAIHGKMKIHGGEHELVIPVRVQSGDHEATATARFEIPYVKWGMKDPSTALLSVKDRVAVEVRAIARASKQP